ncbi:pyruvate dehydrogenase complex dihydrolipoamide acetyltransferase [Candidatus Rhabdochlamydia porcellionis]|jgi:pyruvate dehydrogenase E2 component (dihydrolipoamide acetyltransferase)|uniref:Acetyltransferase component of pyruvate dehydrogenase complex n=1 Tax=Candidatus Rhabdochlamydia porcellionis TaxID=225148 RepID=A0ABX8Z4B5_9BACT|nr:pyruvate dehydrogenase complex dihydrolipoamide acetyltransferase [Candidatus Rhabdochlamydia porcellionis]QZA58931.1 Dihydrolipoyllysine-residue acetyltransferase component of pyruvate dehydrogenase complex [Candidatus Rhabdochlamydia porcellionis]
MPFTVTMPKLSPTMEEGNIVKWLKKEGSYVKEGDAFIEIATDKSTVEHAALDEGWLRKILIQEGHTAQVNQAIAIFTEQENESIEGYQLEGISLTQEAPLQEPQKQPTSYTEEPLEATTRIKASPLARKVAKKQGLNLNLVKGSGPKGRIMSRDLVFTSSSVNMKQQELPKRAAGEFEEESLSPMRKVIAQRLQDAKRFIPHFYCAQEVQMDKVVSLREELISLGIKLSFNDFILRATALALREHPQVNSGFNPESRTIMRFKTIDIAIAVSIPDGLITPIVRSADDKNLQELSKEVKSLAVKAQANKLKQEEYEGGSFTISNLGMYGISEFVAIINPPQAAILAVGAIEEKPIVVDKKMIIGKTLKLQLSADHRVLDGVDAAKFLKTLQKYLEAPSMLLL